MNITPIAAMKLFVSLGLLSVFRLFYLEYVVTQLAIPMMPPMPMPGIVQSHRAVAMEKAGSEEGGIFSDYSEEAEASEMDSVDPQEYGTEDITEEFGTVPPHGGRKRKRRPDSIARSMQIRQLENDYIEFENRAISNQDASIEKSLDFNKPHRQYDKVFPDPDAENEGSVAISLMDFSNPHGNAHGRELINEEQLRQKLRSLESISK